MTGNASITPQKEAQEYHLGILGGTFDPIHNGHIEPALSVAQELSLDEVLVLPAHIPPHKDSTHASPTQRLEMVKRACQSHPIFTPDQRELNRTSISYSVDTLKEVKNEYPHATLYFLMGMDSLLSFTKWHKWQEILNLCHLVVSTRPGYDSTLATLASPQLIQNAITISAEELKSAKIGKILLLTNKVIDISSTEIRDAIARNIDISSYISSDVMEYIEKQRLYRA
ncbi:nicotinate-nucleotide adenylyltransferase [Thalassotalea fusca]